MNNNLLDELSKSMHNLEVLVSAYITITNDLLPPSHAEDVQRLLNSYLEATDKIKSNGLGTVEFIDE